jgi:hypothetical protein
MAVNLDMIETYDYLPAQLEQEIVKCAKGSNGKKYGTAGKKIGNAHLRRAFSEVVQLSARMNAAASPQKVVSASDEQKFRAHSRPEPLFAHWSCHGPSSWSG